MVAIAVGVIIGFVLMFLAFMLTSVLVAAWPVFLVFGFWLLVREARLERERATRH